MCETTDNTYVDWKRSILRVKLVMQSLRCHDDLQNKITETVLINCLETSRDATQAPHDYLYFYEIQPVCRLSASCKVPRTLIWHSLPKSLHNLFLSIELFNMSYTESKTTLQKRVISFVDCQGIESPLLIDCRNIPIQ